MNTIVLISFAIIAGLISLSQIFSFNLEMKKSDVKYHYELLAVSVFMCMLLFGGMSLTYGKVGCFMLYAIDRIFKVVVMTEIVILTNDMINVKAKYISAFISSISYGAVLLFFIDTIFQPDGLEESIFGVYFMPKAPLHLALYFIYYMLYVIMLITLLVYKGSSIMKKCEKHELILIGMVYGFSGAGYLAEAYIIANRMLYIPFILIFNLVSVIAMRQLIAYHESILIDADKFENVLDPGRTDIAFVLDDKLTILYQNKRAEIFAKLMNDEFVGRKLSDVFRFTDSAYGQINADVNGNPFGISADYEPNGHRVNMVIQHRLDNYNEILASVVYVYNIEDIDRPQVIVDLEEDNDDNHIIKSAVSVTRNARVLIVDEDAVFLNVFSRVLTQYEAVVTRAINGLDAIELVKDNVYDIIFITYEMKILDGNETVRRIRKLSGEYYDQVPIVFLTEADINEVFNEFINAGFNDYLVKPVSKRSLASVLTRWLWQRFDDVAVEKAKTKSSFVAQQTEMSKLIDDAEYMLDRKDIKKFSYAVNGLRHCAEMLELIDIVEMLFELEDSIVFDNINNCNDLFEKLKIRVREVATFNI